jgi:hypothetical protein
LEVRIYRDMGRDTDDACQREGAVISLSSTMFFKLSAGTEKRTTPTYDARCETPLWRHIYFGLEDVTGQYTHKKYPA